MKSVDYEYYLIKEILKINLTDNNLNKYKELIKLFNENQKDYLEANLSSIDLSNKKEFESAKQYGLLTYSLMTIKPILTTINIPKNIKTEC